MDAHGNAEKVGTDCGIPSEVTSPDALSYKELVSVQPTMPKWYTSHWWGLTVFDFIRCCEKHAQLREIEDPSYWICGYANRQHSLDTEINFVDLTETSFYRAMQKADGVLLILDQEATPFARMWCSFEIYIAITSKVKLDVAACRADGLPSLLIQGMLPNEPQRAKMVREMEFPHSLMKAGVLQQLEEGGCYLQADREKILKFMGPDGEGVVLVVGIWSRMGLLWLTLGAPQRRTRRCTAHCL